VSKEVLRLHHYANLLKLIQMYLVKEWDIFIHHIFREGNSCADITKLGANHSKSLVMVHQPLPYLSLVLLAYAIGVSFIKTLFFFSSLVQKKYIVFYLLEQFSILAYIRLSLRINFHIYFFFFCLLFSLRLSLKISV